MNMKATIAWEFNGRSSQSLISKVVDGGEPGIRMDKVFSAVVNDPAIFSPFCEDPESAVIEAEWDLVVGNLQVHYL